MNKEQFLALFKETLWCYHEMWGMGSAFFHGVESVALEELISTAEAVKADLERELFALETRPSLDATRLLFAAGIIAQRLEDLRLEENFLALCIEERAASQRLEHPSRRRGNSQPHSNDMRTRMVQGWFDSDD